MEEDINLNPPLKKEEKEKNKDKKGVPLSWFILVIILAVVLSFIISLVVLNLSYAKAQTYSTDSGTIIVQIQPDSSQQGKIVVNIEGNATK